MILKHGGLTCISSCCLSWLATCLLAIDQRPCNLAACSSLNHVTPKFWSTATTNMVQIQRILGALMRQEISKENLRRWERKPVFFHIYYSKHIFFKANVEPDVILAYCCPVFICSAILFYIVILQKNVINGVFFLQILKTLNTDMNRLHPPNIYFSTQLSAQNCRKSIRLGHGPCNSQAKT